METQFKTDTNECTDDIAWSSWTLSLPSESHIIKLQPPPDMDKVISIRVLRLQGDKNNTILK